MESFVLVAKILGVIVLNALVTVIALKVFDRIFHHDKKRNKWN